MAWIGRVGPESGQWWVLTHKAVYQAEDLEGKLDSRGHELVMAKREQQRVE